MEISWVEMCGYLASLLTAVAIMMKHIFWLRVIHFLGCTTFAIYGYYLGAKPIIILNVFLMIVNGYHLALLMKKERV